MYHFNKNTKINILALEQGNKELKNSFPGCTNKIGVQGKFGGNSYVVKNCARDNCLSKYSNIEIISPFFSFVYHPCFLSDTSEDTFLKLMCRGLG